MTDHRGRCLSRIVKRIGRGIDIANVVHEFDNIDECRL